ncbi:hypothetical protein [Haladaptatus cibarius]|uniref:hypothetical protein n=1 Tax=Haladaptatus cibarius TaxID=453847 RepID=UPI00130ECFBC|nr:hypothetical protein [Haladaptatus cibarius]
MSSNEKALFTIGALICFGGVVYGLWLYYTAPDVTLNDVVALLFLVLPGAVCVKRALNP